MYSNHSLNFCSFLFLIFQNTVVVPGNRPDWAENALDAADHCKFVKFVVVISLIISPLDSFFGCNYNDIELEAKVSSINDFAAFFLIAEKQDVSSTFVDGLKFQNISASFHLAIVSFGYLNYWTPQYLSAPKL